MVPAGGPNLRFDMTKSLIVIASLFLAARPEAAEPAPTRNPYESPQAATATSRLDTLVFDRLRQLDLEPAPPCSDAVFVRRAYLDVIGTLPTAAEARGFLFDRHPDKRRRLIDQLLEREEFADYWAMKWGDLLRVKAEFPVNLWPNAAQAYHRWIRTALHENRPYDQFVHDLLTASGSNFRVPPVNFYRAVPSKDAAGIARAVALAFMGMRAEKWPPERLAGLAGFFSQVGYKTTSEWKEEIVFFDPGMATNGLAATARFPDGQIPVLRANQDPREVFARWLITPPNPWLTRSIANRVWGWLLGRGIIHEPDDIRPDNPPSNPELLAYLEQELVTAGYDLKQLYRLILNSQTYQLSSLARTNSPAAAANFAAYPLRRLEAEVLIDALNQITGTTEKYASTIPEPFSYLPEEQRSIALPDGSITSPFLEMFGRPPRDTGLESERNNRFTAANRLHLLNSSHVQRKLERSPLLQSPSQSPGSLRASTATVYLTLLSRFPTAAEQTVIEAYAPADAQHRRAILLDLVWALVNSTEFLYRH